MLLGAGGPAARRTSLPWSEDRPGGLSLLRADSAAVAVLPWGVPALDGLSRTAQNPETGSWLALSGHPLIGGRPFAETDPNLTERVLDGLQARGLAFLDELDGVFALVWLDGQGRRLRLIRDRFGAEPLFYASLDHSVIFGSRLRDLRATGLLAGRIDGQGLVEFLTYCYVPGTATLDAGVARVPPGGLIEMDLDGGTPISRIWYRLPFEQPLPADEAAIASGFRERLERAVHRRLSAAPTGVLLSGGMDSSSILTFARRHETGPIATFAFSCAGQSFDESHYAAQLAAILGTEHTRVTYGQHEAVACADVAAEMEVPFCDVGINEGTWILGRAASGKVSYVLTGDGGDELWASHPVYAAQKLLRAYDALPGSRLLNRALTGLASWLPDSDQKRDLRVKLKRLLPDNGLPKALGPFRWRAYHTRPSLHALLTPEAWSLIRDRDPYAPVLAAYEGYRGPDDGLSAHLYADYTTTSSYYFSRLLLLRRFGIEHRLPFYDRELVEYGARIPAHLKLEGVERTKRLFRVAMEGVLPDVINHRRDKLGHSVPMKNWMREEGELWQWVASLLAPAAVRSRGLFREEAVTRLVDEHRRRRHNHSHRLWALAVLETWLRAFPIGL